MNKFVFINAILLSVFASGLSVAEVKSEGAEPVQNLQQLLHVIKQERIIEREKHKQREERFLQERNQQQKRLQQLKLQKQKVEGQAAPLLAATKANQSKIEDLKQELSKQTQDLGDIQSAFAQFSGDVSANLNQSLISSAFPDRHLELERLAAIKTLPTIQDLESLWLLMQEEMTAASIAQQYSAEVVTAEGEISLQEVVRIAGFTAVTQDAFLRYVPETRELLLLARQPPKRLINVANEYMQSQQKTAAMIIDPTKGSLLSMMSYAPNLRERVEQGGTIGLIIISLGIIGLLITLWRSLYLTWVAVRVKAQLRNPELPSDNNPLGRILKRAQNVDVEVEENIQFKLDELVLSELPRLERGQGFIKLLAAVAPLLGLLGTVTGMILTFQSISLFGNGDPKLMAGGISQALMTTVLGLVAAIPLLFGHNLVASLSRNLVQKLDEQSAGILARAMEKADG